MALNLFCKCGNSLSAKYMLVNGPVDMMTIGSESGTALTIFSKHSRYFSGGHTDAYDFKPPGLYDGDASILKELSLHSAGNSYSSYSSSRHHTCVPGYGDDSTGIVRLLYGLHPCSCNTFNATSIIFFVMLTPGSRTPSAGVMVTPTR